MVATHRIYFFMDHHHIITSLTNEMMYYASSSPQSAIIIFLNVAPLPEPKASTASTTSVPSTTFPKTTWLPSSHDVWRRKEQMCWVFEVNVQVKTINARPGQLLKRTVSRLCPDQHSPSTTSTARCAWAQSSHQQTCSRRCCSHRSHCDSVMCILLLRFMVGRKNDSMESSRTVKSPPWHINPGITRWKELFPKQQYEYFRARTYYRSAPALVRQRNAIWHISFLASAKRTEIVSSEGRHVTTELCAGQGQST